MLAKEYPINQRLVLVIEDLDKEQEDCYPHTFGMKGIFLPRK
jgi:hypothetical protein